MTSTFANFKLLAANQPKITPVKEKYVEPYNFENSELKEEYVPFYFKTIFSTPFIPNEERQRFIDNFLIRYLTDNIFYESMQGKYLLFMNHKWEGVIENLEEAMNYGLQGDRKQTWGIGHSKSDFSNYGTSYISGDRPTVVIDPDEINNIHNILNKRTGNRYNKNIETRSHYMVNIALSHRSDLNFLDELDRKQALFSVTELIYDLGAQISMLPFFGIFNRQLSQFDETNPQYGVMFSEWNKKIGDTNNGFMYVAGGYKIPIINIIFNEPLYESIEGLKPVPVHKFYITFEENPDQMILLGLDVIDQHTSILSNYSGRTQLRISNQRDEISHQQEVKYLTDLLYVMVTK